MGIAIVSLIVLLIVAVVAIPILARVLGEAASRNPNETEGEENAEGDRSQQSGPNRD
ncbi:MAG: hypothetical protein ACR2JR_13900 [Rubrobacteraceae bacterium]